MLRFGKFGLLFLHLLLVVGCGGGGSDAVGVGGPGPGAASTVSVGGTGGGAGAGGNGGTPPPVARTGTLRVEQTLLNRAVVTEIDSVRITGYGTPNEGDEVFENVSGSAIYGPVTLVKAATYTLDDVPVEVQAIRIEYLQEGSVRGVFSQPVTIVPDEPFEIVDPNYTDLAGLFTRIELEGNFFSLFGDTLPGETFAILPESPLASNLRVIGYAGEGGDGIDITHLVVLESANLSIVDFDFQLESGTNSMVFGGTPGITEVTARFLDLETSRPVEVLYPDGPFLTEIKLLQNNGVVPFNVPTQLTALGTFSDGSLRNITSEVEWSEMFPDDRPPGLGFDANTPGLVTGLQTDGHAWVSIYYRPQRFGALGGVYLRPVGVTDPFSQ